MRRPISLAACPICTPARRRSTNCDVASRAPRWTRARRGRYYKIRCSMWWRSRCRRRRSRAFHSCRVLKRRRLEGPGQKRVALYTADGDIVEQVELVGGAVADEWANVFQAHPVCEEDMSCFLCFVPQDLGHMERQWARGRIWDAVVQTPLSASGLDGLTSSLVFDSSVGLGLGRL